VVIFRKSVEGASQGSFARFVMQARRATGVRGRVAVLVTSSREMRKLNRRFRGKDRATDVLSFPAPAESGDNAEGDIAISADIAAANAKRLRHRTAEELKILVLHGLLHLAGHDHEVDDGKMERLEQRLRRKLRLPESLIARATAQVPRTSRQSHPSPNPSVRRPRKRRT
jgi:probable rRNA maturation factor